MRPNSSPLSIDVSRRRLLRTSLLGGAVLSTVSASALLSGCSATTPANGYAVLRASDVGLLAALLPVVMAGAAGKNAIDATTMQAVVQDFDRFVATTSHTFQKQLRQLFDLLTFPPTRYAVAGVSDPWAEAAPEDIEAFLLRWRDSRFELLRGGYVALTQLLAMSWYLAPARQAAIGYAPPRVIVEAA